MKRLRTLLDRTTLASLFLALGLGWGLWLTALQDDRGIKERKQDTGWQRFIHRCWPPDGEPGWGAPEPGSFGGAWRLKSYDWLFLIRHRLSPPAVPPEALVLSMEEESHTILDQPLSLPWDRSVHAQVLERCLTNGARAVVFDIVFADMKNRGNAEADKALARAFRIGSNRVVVTYATTVAKESTRAPGVIPPPRILREALIAPARPDVRENRYYAGLPEFEPDYDQRVRRHGSSFSPNKNTLAWSLAGLLQWPCVTNSLTPGKDPAEGERWLNYYGPAGYLDTLKYYQVLTNDNGRGPVPGIIFTNRIVFIGSGTLSKFSGERKDAYVNPLAALGRENERFIAGVEVHATAALNLLRQDWLTRMNLRTEFFLIVSVAIFCGFCFPRLAAWQMSLAAIGLMTSVATLAYVLFLERYVWFAWLIPLTQIGAVWLLALVSNTARLFVQNRLYQQQLGLYLSPKLVKKFAHDKDQSLTRPGATKHELTIFFSDIAGFTSISEGLDSDDLAHTMNRYFQNAVGNCIFPTDGTVVKYIGDAIFAFWNAPDLQPDHAHRACDAALRFRTQEMITVNDKPLITRIGLHSGVANVGNFGSTQRIDYTAIGENINLASRMEGLNKYVGTETLVTEATYVQVAGQFVFRPLGRFILKGFERAFAVYELCGPLNRSAEFTELHTAFASALAEYQQGNLNQARKAFETVATRWSTDGPTRFYLKALDELDREPPSTPWTGVVELKEK